jgi:hypothetical protein
MKHKDLFTELMEKLSKRGKTTSFDAIKRYLHIHYRITFTDRVLYDRLLEFKNSIQSENNKKD